MIEVLITTIIVSILAVIAVPSFQNLLARNRLATQANEFVTDLNLARSEAIKRGERVTVCKSADGGNCTASDEWGQGWIVFMDVNGDVTVADPSNILRVRPAIQGATLTGDTEVANYISFVPTGATRLVNGRTQSGAISLNGTDQAITVFINTAGRVRTQKS
jgi:type IV fimbrial biogenesis protein FimT